MLLSSGEGRRPCEVGRGKYYPHFHLPEGFSGLFIATERVVSRLGFPSLVAIFMHCSTCNQQVGDSHQSCFGEIPAKMAFDPRIKESKRFQS